MSFERQCFLSFYSKECWAQKFNYKKGFQMREKKSSCPGTAAFAF